MIIEIHLALRLHNDDPRLAQLVKVASQTTNTIPQTIIQKKKKKLTKKILHLMKEENCVTF